MRTDRHPGRQGPRTGAQDVVLHQKMKWKWKIKQVRQAPFATQFLHQVTLRVIVNLLGSKFWKIRKIFFQNFIFIWSCFRAGVKKRAKNQDLSCFVTLRGYFARFFFTVVRKTDQIKKLSSDLWPTQNFLLKNDFFFFFSRKQNYRFFHPFGNFPSLQIKKFEKKGFMCATEKTDFGGALIQILKLAK